MTLDSITTFQSMEAVQFFVVRFSFYRVSYKKNSPLYFQCMFALIEVVLIDSWASQHAACSETKRRVGLSVCDSAAGENFQNTYF